MLNQIETYATFYTKLKIDILFSLAHKKMTPQKIAGRHKLDIRNWIQVLQENVFR